MNCLSWELGLGQKDPALWLCPSTTVTSFFLLEQLNLSGMLGTPPGLLRSVKNKVCPCRQKTLTCKGKLSKEQLWRHNSALNIYSKEHSVHIIVLSQDRHMLSVPLKDLFPLP